MPEAPLDILAQQIVAEIECARLGRGRAVRDVPPRVPYRDLMRENFTSVCACSPRDSLRGADARCVHPSRRGQRLLRGRSGARLTAITSGGAIPDNADYQVVLEPESAVVGTLDEDFAIESLAGDIFQLGNTACRIIRVERGVVRVEDAHGAPPTIPFGSAKLRRAATSSQSVSFRRELERSVRGRRCRELALGWLEEDLGLDRAAAEQIVDYLAAAHRRSRSDADAKRCLRALLRRSGRHAARHPFALWQPDQPRLGARPRKRFCRKFNFELQAAATEDDIVLSLATAHSFALAEVARSLSRTQRRELFVQALLDAPMFGTRWRWVAGVSLALLRFSGRKKVPPQLMRRWRRIWSARLPGSDGVRGELVGAREVPDHPLVAQTVHDCLNEAMDIDGLERLLADIESGAIRIVARDLTEPSPLAREVLTAGLMPISTMRRSRSAARKR